MRILFVHQNFPAQFGRLAYTLAQQGTHEIVYLTERVEGQLPGVRKVLFQTKGKTSPATHPYLLSLDQSVRQGEAAYRAAKQLKQEGFTPDIIYAHVGWGAEMYLKDLYPNVPFVGYFEWFYQSHGSDVDFGRTEPLDPDELCRLRTKNMAIAQGLYTVDAAVSPTYWQQSQFPHPYVRKIQVIHDGIDTEVCTPKPGARLVLPNLKLDLSAAKEIVTYVGRGMDPYRGFLEFMKTASLLQKRRPHCHIVVVGAERIAYGAPHPSGKSYKQVALESFDFDCKRLHFTGRIDYPLYRQVMQASTVHVYLTRPFVLSWSMMEAMSFGCALVASNTQPVTEMINDGVNGILADFFKPQEIADRVEELLNDPLQRQALGVRARATILDRYDLTTMLNRQYRFLESVVAAYQGRVSS